MMLVQLLAAIVWTYLFQAAVPVAVSCREECILVCGRSSGISSDGKKSMSREDKLLPWRKRIHYPGESMEAMHPGSRSIYDALIIARYSGQGPE